MDPSFALALLALDGVGHATAHRLLERFPTYDALRATPREQVLLRLAGLPRAEATVARLFDDAAMAAALGRTRADLDGLAARHVRVLAPGHAHWPVGLRDVTPAERPAVLFCFGDASALGRAAVAFFARPPLPSAAFEGAQALVRRLLGRAAPIACGARPGFDVVVHKLCAEAGHPCVAVAASGLGRVERAARPSLATVARAGGALVSSFPMEHGPFAHDDAERAVLQAALAGPSVFVAPHGEAPEARALAWAAAAGRPTFAFAAPDDGPPLPDAVRLLATPADLDLVLRAAEERIGA